MESDHRPSRDSTCGDHRSWSWRVDVVQRRRAVPESRQHLMLLPYDATTRQAGAGQRRSPYTSRGATLVVSSRSCSDVESSSTLTVIQNVRALEYHRISDISISLSKVDIGEHGIECSGRMVLLVSYYSKSINRKVESKMTTKKQKLGSNFAMTFQENSEAEECFQIIQMLATAEKDRSRNNGGTVVNSGHDSLPIDGMGCRTPQRIFGAEFRADGTLRENVPNTSATEVDAENQNWINLDSPIELWSEHSTKAFRTPSSFLEQDHKCGNEFSNLPSLVHSYRNRASLRPYKASSNTTKALSERGALSQPQEVRANNTVELPINTGSPSGTNSSNTTKALSERGALSQPQELRANNIVELPINTGSPSGTNSKSGSASLDYGPPSFSQLLTQASQSTERSPKCTPESIFDAHVDVAKSTSFPKRNLPHQATNSNCEGVDNQKSARQTVQPRENEKTAFGVQDANRTATLADTHPDLREQIVACLLEPDFEDFVAEVEKVWDQLEATISDDNIGLVDHLRRGSKPPNPKLRSESLG